MAWNNYPELHSQSHRDVYGDAEDLKCLLITTWEIAERESCGDAESEIRGVNTGRLLSICDVGILLMSSAEQAYSLLAAPVLYCYI